MIAHTLPEGYYFNYVHDAAHLYWAARWLELNKSTDEKDIVIDKLIVMRLRRIAKDIMEGAVEQLTEKKSVTADGQALAQLVEEIVK